MGSEVNPSFNMVADDDGVSYIKKLLDKKSSESLSNLETLGQRVGSPSSVRMMSPDRGSRRPKASNQSFSASSAVNIKGWTPTGILLLRVLYQ